MQAKRKNKIENVSNNCLITSIGSFSADITIKRLKSVGGGAYCWNRYLQQRVDC